MSVLYSDNELLLLQAAKRLIQSEGELKTLFDKFRKDPDISGAVLLMFIKFDLDIMMEGLLLILGFLFGIFTCTGQLFGILFVLCIRNSNLITKVSFLVSLIKNVKGKQCYYTNASISFK